jgi:zinc protease
VKHTRLFKIANRYRYFIAGGLVVLLGYGIVFLVKRMMPEREPALPVVQKINFERFVLANGLQVIVHSDTAAPVVSLNMSYRVGSRDEPSGKIGLTHLTEHIMLASASAHRGAEEKTWVERLGAWDYNGATDRDRTRLYMTVPKDSLDAALWVESERMGYLSEKLSEEDVALARQDVVNELRRNKAESATTFEAILTDALFAPDHPYSHLPGGAPEEIETISLQDVRQWLKEHYRPNNATLVIAGDIDPSAVKSRVETYFGQIQGGRRSRQTVTWIPWHEPPSRYATPAMPAETFALVWALPGYGSPDLDYVDLARHVIEARLTQRLVIESRAARAVQLDLKPYQLCSLLVLTVRMSAEGHDKEIQTRIEQELVDLGRDGATPREIVEAKRNIFTSLLFTSERAGGAVGVAEILASAAVLAGDAVEFNKTLERIQGASNENITPALNTWLPLRAATLITSGTDAGSQTSPAPVSERPQSMPTVGEAGAQVRVVPEQMKLANGLTVLVAKRVGTIGALKLVWRKDPALGVRDELLTKAVSNLLAEGNSERRSSDPLVEYARLSSKLVLEDTTSYYAIGSELPSQNIEQGLTALSEMVTGARFQESRVAALRQQWAKRVTKTEPTSWRLQMAVLLRLISRGKLDEARQLDCTALTSFTTTDIQRTYDTRFRPDDATLVVVGDTNLASLQERITQLFGSWRASPRAQDSPAAPMSAAESADAPVYVIDRAAADYAVVLAGVPLPPGVKLSGISGDVITRLLDSRVSRTLRDETSISHETFAGLMKWDEGGIVYVDADARSEQVPNVIRLVEQAFRPVEDPGVFCQSEFKQAQAASAQRSLQALESAQDLTSFLTSSLLDTEQQAQAGQDSCEQVLDLSRRLSDHPRFIWLVLGNGTQLAERLRQLGYKTEIIQKPCWSSLY